MLLYYFFLLKFDQHLGKESESVKFRVLKLKFTPIITVGDKFCYYILDQNVVTTAACISQWNLVDLDRKSYVVTTVVAKFYW